MYIYLFIKIAFELLSLHLGCFQLSHVELISHFLSYSLSVSIAPRILVICGGKNNPQQLTWWASKHHLCFWFSIWYPMISLPSTLLSHSSAKDGGKNPTEEAWAYFLSGKEDEKERGGFLMKEQMNERVRQGGGNASPAVLNTWLFARASKGQVWLGASVRSHAV